MDVALVLLSTSHKIGLAQLHALFAQSCIHMPYFLLFDLTFVHVFFKSAEIQLIKNFHQHGLTLGQFLLVLDHVVFDLSNKFYELEQFFLKPSALIL